MQLWELKLLQQRYWHQNIGLEKVKVQRGYSFWGKKCSSSFSKRRITYRTVMLLLGGHTYLHFCLNWQRQHGHLKHNSPRQCQAGGLSALGTCHRNRDLELPHTGVTQTDSSVLTPLKRFCDGCSIQICKSVRMLG